MVLPHLLEQTGHVDPREQRREPTRATEANQQAVVHVVLHPLPLLFGEELQDVWVGCLAVRLTGSVGIGLLGGRRIECRIGGLVPTLERVRCPVVHHLTPDQPGPKVACDLVFPTGSDVSLASTDEEFELSVPVTDDPTVEGFQHLLKGQHHAVEQTDVGPCRTILVQQVSGVPPKTESTLLAQVHRTRCRDNRTTTDGRDPLRRRSGLHLGQVVNERHHRVIERILVPVGVLGSEHLAESPVSSRRSRDIEVSGLVERIQQGTVHDLGAYLRKSGATKVQVLPRLQWTLCGALEGCVPTVGVYRVVDTLDQLLARDCVPSRILAAQQEQVVFFSVHEGGKTCEFNRIRTINGTNTDPHSVCVVVILVQGRGEVDYSVPPVVRLGGTHYEVWIPPDLQQVVCPHVLTDVAVEGHRKLPTVCREQGCAGHRISVQQRHEALCTTPTHRHREVREGQPNVPTHRTATHFDLWRREDSDRSGVRHRVVGHRVDV